MSTPTTDNSTLFDEGWKKATQIIYGHLYDQLFALCDKLVTWPPKVDHAGWNNLTGNTVTSYACGLYLDGEIVYMTISGDSMKKPVRYKLVRGEYYQLDVDGPDYDGRLRSWGPAPVDTDGGFGRDFSMKFLESYVSQVKSGFEIVMCTGTEYSTYLENVRGADVLTGTFERAISELAKNIKPMKK